MVKLSIITINYNNKVGLQRTIDSVIAQSYQDFEWIIIDGGSIDGSKELIEQNDVHISYWISESDKGIYNAMNKGIKVAHGEYLLFLNSGDYLAEKDVLYKVIPLLNGKDFYVGNQLNGNKLIMPNIDTVENLCNTMAFWGLPHQSVFINKQIFAVYGLYCEELLIVADWWLFYNALILGQSTIAKLSILISVYDTHGISSVQYDYLTKEKKELLCSKSQGTFFFYDFYRQNYEIVQAIKGNKYFWRLFRFYYYFYRKWMK